MADDRAKLQGQRAAIREHIEKYNRYDIDHEKEFALKTIRNAQAQITKILSKHPHWDSAPEDSWAP